MLAKATIARYSPAMQGPTAADLKVSLPGLYWPKNIAKYRAINAILAESQDDIAILDYGAGAGSDWPLVLRDHPHITLYCFEPSRDAAHILSQRVPVVIDESELADPPGQVDYVISFSVFEHVRDRKRYLETAKRWLRPGGKFILNYDDGHFRTKIDLAQPTSWWPAFKVEAVNRCASMLPYLGLIGKYQKRVVRRQIDALVAETGFVVAGERYENLESMKRLASTLSDEELPDFCEMWLALENQLNDRFLKNCKESMGDTANLWREMLSRTLILK